MKLTFLGAAGTVTGSKYLMEFRDEKILIDCGMFQGLKELRLLNWEEPKFDPKSIKAVLLTHGHLDHSGYLPRLVKAGFRGDIYGTAPTLKIAEIVLKNSATIQEEEAERANREGYSKHKPAKPFYDLYDVEQTKKMFRPINDGQILNIANFFKVSFEYNGHIMGSTYVQVEVDGKTFIFSGDLGREKDYLLYPPKKPKAANVLIIESTYGGTLHPKEEAVLHELSDVINKTILRGGSVFIPSFAVERIQLLMLLLWRLLKSNKIPKIPMYMDSPMGEDVLKLFQYSHFWHKLKEDEYNQMCSYFHLVRNYSESTHVRDDKKPKIVIAGSGMLEGGRILNYLENSAGNEKDTLMLVGYQAEGTRGRKLLEGEKEIKMFGKIIPFRMELKKIDGLSAHGDQHDLLSWLSDLKEKPSRIFIVHGELEQSKALKQKLYEVKKWVAEIPKLNEAFEL